MKTWRREEMLKNLSYHCEVFRKDLHEIWREIWQTSYDFYDINKLSPIQMDAWKHRLQTDLDNLFRVMDEVKKEYQRYYGVKKK
jgi:hypothetical protein